MSFLANVLSNADINFDALPRSELEAISQNSGVRYFLEFGKGIAENGITAKQATFLAVYSRVGSIAEASRLIGMDVTAHTKWMARTEAYPACFAQAEALVADTLEAEAIRRGRDGYRKAVWYKGMKCGEEQVYSDRLLELTLKAHKPDKYRDRTDVNLTGLDTLAERLAESRRIAAQRSLESGD